MENIGLRANKMQSCNCFRRFDLSRLRWAQSPLGFLNRSSALWRRNFSKSIYFYFMFLQLVGVCPYNSHTQIMERASSWWQFKPWADFFKPLSKINWHILDVIHSLHAILFIVLPLYNHKRSHLSQFAIAVREVERKNHTHTQNDTQYGCDCQMFTSTFVLSWFIVAKWKVARRENDVHSLLILLVYSNWLSFAVDAVTPEHDAVIIFKMFWWENMLFFVCT